MRASWGLSIASGRRSPVYLAVRLLSAVLLVALAAGCGVTLEILEPEARAGESAAGLPGSDTTTGEFTDAAHGEAAVTLAFAGDVMFEGMIRPQLEADPEGLLDPIAPVLQAADLAVVNLETAITTAGDPAPKQYVFRAPPSALRALQAAGVDVASLANNHGMDYGRRGLEDTFEAFDAVGLPLVGAGRDRDQAYAPHTATVGDRRIAIIGATQVMDSAFLASWPATAQRPGLASAKDGHEQRLVRSVAEARASADTVVVYLHWGSEGEACPSERQELLARRLVDAGADVIVGGHAHRLQGAGMLDGALVGYGLGNFVFYSTEGAALETGVLTVTVAGREIIDYGWTPARIRAGIPHPLRGAEASAAESAWERLRDCTNLTR